MGEPRTCQCGHFESCHGEAMAPDGPPRMLFSACKAGRCDCKEFRARGANRVKISDEDKQLGVWLIKQHQRMIHEIRQRLGI